MQKRAYERINTNVRVKFLYGSDLYSGTVTNLSENGMYIQTNRCLPFDAKFDILFQLKGEVKKFPIKVFRIEKTDGFYNGMGVELIEHPRDYLEFVKKLKASLPSF
jgi:hypothetical protein